MDILQRSVNTIRYRNNVIGQRQNNSSGTISKEKLISQFFLICLRRDAQKIASEGRKRPRFSRGKRFNQRFPKKIGVSIRVIFATLFTSTLLLTGCQTDEWDLMKITIEDGYDAVPGDDGLIDEAFPEINEADRAEDEENLYAAVPVESLPLWSKPDTQSAELGRLPSGELVKRIDGSGDDSGFYHILTKQNGHEGYLAANFCTPVYWRFEGLKELPVVDISKAEYTYEEMQADLNELVEAYPEILSCRSSGQSVSGREIYQLTLGNPDAERHVFVDASIHGREYMTTLLTMKLIEYYASQYYNGCYHNLFYSEIFDQVCFHIYPMVNPDGVSISQLGEDAVQTEEQRQLLRDCYETDKKYLSFLPDGNGTYYWADNYRGLPRETADDYISYDEYLTQWKSNANGVDINDNFDIGWEEAKYKTYPSHGQAKGKEPGSEPETRLLMAESQKKDYSCYLNYHTRGQLIYYDSFGMEEALLQESYELAQALSEFTRYPIYSTADHEKDKAGFGDYVHTALKKPGVTIELGRDPSPVPIEEFTGIFTRHRETWAMLAYRLSE